MIEPEKIRASVTKNSRNLGTHWICEISLILFYTYVITRDQNKIVFYANDNIDWNQFQ